MNRRSILTTGMKALGAIGLAGLFKSVPASDSAVHHLTIEPGLARAVALARILEGDSRPPISPEPTISKSCDRPTACKQRTEDLARKIMSETGEWKETIRDRRDGRNPIVVTVRGCCCCEVTLLDGAHDPEWTFKTRALTVEERQSFHAEYGQQAALLFAMGFPEQRYRIRGFILNGRIPGWNLSVYSKAKSNAWVVA